MINIQIWFEKNNTNEKKISHNYRIHNQNIVNIEIEYI